MTWNYKIKTIAVPEIDDEGNKTGGYLTLEVVGIEKMKTFVQMFEGGSYTEEKLYIICFHKEIGKPKKLYVISADSGEIEILKYEKNEVNEFRNSRKGGRTKRATTIRNDNNTKYGKTK